MMRRGSIEGLVPLVFLAIAVLILLLTITACVTKTTTQVTVTNNILEPSNRGIAANSFMLYTPTGSYNQINQLMSFFVQTNDADAEGMIASGLKEMFPDKRVEIVVDDRTISNDIRKSSDEFNLVTKNVVLADGTVTAINVRFYR